MNEGTEGPGGKQKGTIPMGNVVAMYCKDMPLRKCLKSLSLDNRVMKQLFKKRGEWRKEMRYRVVFCST